MFHETEFETRREMPGENRDQLLRGGDDSGSAPGGRRESSRSGSGGGGSGEPDLRNRGSTATMIPLPRTGQFAAAASQNQKIVKTERNRQRLIMEGRGTVAAAIDVLNKERKIGMREVETLQNNWRVSAANCSAIARFVEEFGDSPRNEKVISLSEASREWNVN